jgi:ABC-type proline/glycine betaine transport system ATPase subunit
VQTQRVASLRRLQDLTRFKAATPAVPPEAGERADLGSLSHTALAATRRRAIGYVFQDLNLIPASPRWRT